MGISNNEVTPPSTAALLPLSRSSASVEPGSLKWTCVSIIPGKMILLVTSITFELFNSILPIFLILFPDKPTSVLTNLLSI